ncbi:hypothetical protein DXG01_010802 [Tephrocybe rancida]|nr:hypothetical protein DXG01_010802 [Tephrocybe rancida]
MSSRPLSATHLSAEIESAMLKDPIEFATALDAKLLFTVAVHAKKTIGYVIEMPVDHFGLFLALPRTLAFWDFYLRKKMREDKAQIEQCLIGSKPPPFLFQLNSAKITPPGVVIFSTSRKEVKPEEFGLRRLPKIIQVSVVQYGAGPARQVVCTEELAQEAGKQYGWLDVLG